jgi:hypothetical protein
VDLPYDRNLWDRTDEEADAVIGPVEPSDYGIDPLNYLQTT